MDPILLAVLSVFGFYSGIGVIVLLFVYKSTLSKERLIYGLGLMYLAAFLLTGIALVTGVTDQPGWMERLNAEEKLQIAEFKQYMIFLGGMFTLIFGGVGVNLVTSGLVRGDIAEVIETLRKIEKKVDEASATNRRVDSKISWLIIANLIILFTILVALYFIWAH